jgi:hypothetical protein
MIRQDHRATLQAAATVLILAAFWLITRPELGLVNDAQFYAVQVLYAENPKPFAGDVFFQFGSQGQFTAFTALCLPFYRALGLARADLLLLIAGQIGFLGGLYALARKLFPGALAAALAGVILLPVNLSLLEPGEAVLTPRIYAEGLCLFAMADMLGGRTWRPLALLAVAMALHPLMTLPAAAVCFVWRAGRQPVWWGAAALLTAACVALAAGGVEPFGRLLLRFDPAWLAVTAERDSFCFVTKWADGLFLPVAAAFLLCGFAAVTGPALAQKFARTVLAVMLVAFVLMFLGGDMVHDVLVVDVQPWRGVWLLAVAAYLAAGPALLSAAGPVLTRVFFGFALAVTAVSGFILSLCLVSVPAVGISCIALARATGRLRATSRIGLAVCLAVLIFFAVFGLVLWVQAQFFVPGALSQTVTILAVIAAGCAALSVAPRWPGAAAAAGLVLVIVAATHWDQRTAWTRFIDTGSAPALAASLPASGAVYWEGEDTATWFLLHRANFSSCDQGSGVLFVRGTALAYAARTALLAPLSPVDVGLSPICPQPGVPGGVITDPGQHPPPSAAAVRSVCGAGPVALILPQPAGGLPANAVWRPPVPASFETRYGLDHAYLPIPAFYIYDCNDLRS